MIGAVAVFQGMSFRKERGVSALDEFEHKIHTQWLGPFCHNRGYVHWEFVEDSLNKLSEADARDFMSAIDSGLVIHQAGAFEAPCSKAKEYVFWEGPADLSPRRLTLWLEPIITIAGLWRMHRDYGWPAERLGAQSSSYAFDFVGYEADQTTEFVLCEVKPTRKALDLLINLMQKHRGTPKEAVNECPPAEKNALKKVIALRESHSRTFWALGPDNYGQVFTVRRDPSGEVILIPATDSALRFERTSGFGKS